MYLSQNDMITFNRTYVSCQFFKITFLSRTYVFYAFFVKKH